MTREALIHHGLAACHSQSSWRSCVIKVSAQFGQQCGLNDERAITAGLIRPVRLLAGGAAMARDLWSSERSTDGGPGRMLDREGTWWIGQVWGASCCDASGAQHRRDCSTVLPVVFRRNSTTSGLMTFQMPGPDREKDEGCPSSCPKRTPSAVSGSRRR